MKCTDGSVISFGTEWRDCRLFHYFMTTLPHDNPPNIHEADFGAASERRSSSNRRKRDHEIFWSAHSHEVILVWSNTAQFLGNRVWQKVNSCPILGKAMSRKLLNEIFGGTTFSDQPIRRNRMSNTKTSIVNEWLPILLAGIVKHPLVSQTNYAWTSLLWDGMA